MYKIKPVDHLAMYFELNFKHRVGKLSFIVECSLITTLCLVYSLTIYNLYIHHLARNY